jgi:hypothetical protein
MKRLLFATVYALTITASSYAGYIWGWYDGFTYQSIIAGLAETKVSVSAAKSLRLEDPELALELLESNISWMDMSLTDAADSVPPEEKGNFDIVMRHLAEYRAAYGTTPRIDP